MQMFSESEVSLELEHRILERIAGRVHNLRVVRMQGRLILEGSTGSFHAKQLAKPEQRRYRRWFCGCYVPADIKWKLCLAER